MAQAIDEKHPESAKISKGVNMDVFVNFDVFYAMPDIEKDFESNKARRKYSKTVKKCVNN